MYDSAGVRIRAFPVKHGSWEWAFGYRVDAPGKSIASWARSQPRLLVLTHIVRMGGTDEELARGIRAGGWSGPLVIGRDLASYQAGCARAHLAGGPNRALIPRVFTS